MAKKKDKKKEKNLLQIKGINMNGDLVKEITLHTSKNGKIHGSKKEKQTIRDACPHNRYVNKRMTKKNPYVRSDGKGRCYCKICKQTFKASFFNDEEVNKRTNNFSEMVTQAALLNQAIDGGNESANFIASLNIGVKRFPKLYKRLSSVSAKKDKMHKKKNKTQTTSYGGWSINR